MAIFLYTLEFLDALGRTSSVKVKGDFPLYTDARVAADALLGDAQALTDAIIYREALTQITDLTGTNGPLSDVTKRIQASVTLGTVGRKLHTVNFPAPVGLVQNGLDLLTTQALWTNYMANFAPGAGWTLSDGETYGQTVGGKIISVRYTKSNAER